MAASCELQLSITLKTLQCTGTEESLQTLADYKRRKMDEQQQALAIRNRNMIASKVYGMQAGYLASNAGDLSGEENPFVNKRDANNMKAVIKKLNEHIQKIDVFKQRAKELTELELVQKKVKQFGEALGFVVADIGKRELLDQEKLQQKKLQKFSNNPNQSNLELVHIENQSEEVYASLVELNQIIKRREIMTNINHKYLESNREVRGKMTWG